MNRPLMDMALKLALIIALPSACAACASTKTAPPEPVVKIVEVKVPVARSCVPKTLGAPPRYVDTDAALRGAAGPEDRYQLLYAGRKQRVARAGEVEPVITGCRD